MAGANAISPAAAVDATPGDWQKARKLVGRTP